MSSHRLDVAGARQLQMTVNDPAATVAWMPAKAGEDVEVSVGGREVRLALPENARIQRRRVVVARPARGEDGKLKEKVDGEYEMEETTETRLVLVLTGSASLFVRASNALFADDDPAKPTYEQHPHSSVSARRFKEPHYLEAGEIATEVEVSAIGHVLDEAIDGPLEA